MENFKYLIGLTKKMKKGKKTLPGKHALKFFIYVLMLVSLAFIFKSIIFLAGILVLDFWKIYTKVNFKIEFPLDFGLFGIILFAYTGRPWIAFFIIPVLLVTRALLGLIRPTFLIKFPLLLIVSYLTFYLRAISLPLLALYLILFRYAMEFGLELIIFGTVTAEKIHWRVINIVFAYSIYATLGMLLLHFI